MRRCKHRASCRTSASSVSTMVSEPGWLWKYATGCNSGARSSGEGAHDLGGGVLGCRPRGRAAETPGWVLLQDPVPSRRRSRRSVPKHTRRACDPAGFWEKRKLPGRCVLQKHSPPACCAPYPSELRDSHSGRGVVGEGVSPGRAATAQSGRQGVRVCRVGVAHSENQSGCS